MRRSIANEQQIEKLWRQLAQRVSNGLFFDGLLLDCCCTDDGIVANCEQYLNAEELSEMTGYVQPAAQIRWLKKNGYTYRERIDGLPLVGLADIYSRQCKKVDIQPYPRLEWMKERN